MQGLQTLKGFKRKRKYEAMQDLEDHFRLSYREVGEVAPLIAEAGGEIVKLKQREHTKEPSKNREDQKLFSNYGYQNWRDDEFKE